MKSTVCGIVLVLATSSCLSATKTDLPFWKNSAISGDTLFFIQEQGEPHASAWLLFVPKCLPTLQSSTREVQYEAGKDFVWTPGSRKIELTAGSRIPFKKRLELYPAPDHNTAFATSGAHPGRALLFSEGHFFHDLQVVAEYETAEHWRGFIPKKAPELLPRTLAKLKNHEQLRLVVLGDSISTGANASGVVGIQPYLPGYPDLLASRLAEQSESEVIVKNLSVGGTTSAWGLSRIPDVIAAKPDLLIIAFGMNDSIRATGTAPKQFGQNIREMVAAVRKALAGCEIILVAPMIGNAEWDALEQGRFPDFRAELEKLTERGVAVADVTSLWADLLKRKRFHDLTGNGLNHPNDFGQEVYAEVITALVNR